MFFSVQPPTIFTARRNDIVVEAVIDEVLIYDQRSDVAHCLGDIAAVVWRTCEGGATLGEIAEQIIARALAGSSDDATELANTAVSELREKGLLETSGVGAGLLSRRHALRRMAGVGAAAVVAPLVVSAAVPKSASAHGSPASCKSLGQACTGTDFAHNNCCPGSPSPGPFCSGTCQACFGFHVACTADVQCCSLNCTGNKCQT